MRAVAQKTQDSKKIHIGLVQVYNASSDMNKKERIGKNMSPGAVGFIIFGLFITLSLGVGQIRTINDVNASKTAGYVYLISGLLMVISPILNWLGLPKMISFLMIMAGVIAYIVGVLIMSRHSKRF